MGSNLSLRFMRTDDIQQVVSIDRDSFATPWSARSYAFEVNESHTSYMAVLESCEWQPVQGIKKLLYNLRGQPEVDEMQRVIVGYGGLWKIQEEAHISTIASHPAHRGKHYGEIVLAGMLQRSVHLQAEYVVLEVRVTNDVAQNLYRKYGFEVVGVKKEYYRAEKEDAYDMRLLLNKPGIIPRLHDLYTQLKSHVAFDDRYSHTPHPRLR